MRTTVTFVWTGGVIVLTSRQRRRGWTRKTEPEPLVGRDGWYWSRTFVVVPWTVFQMIRTEVEFPQVCTTDPKIPGGSGQMVVTEDS